MFVTIYDGSAPAVAGTTNAVLSLSYHRIVENDHADLGTKTFAQRHICKPLQIRPRIGSCPQIIVPGHSKTHQDPVAMVGFSGKLSPSRSASESLRTWSIASVSSERPASLFWKFGSEFGRIWWLSGGLIC